MGILVFPQTVNLLCGHGEVTIIVACRSVKCGICGFVTPLAAQPVNAADGAKAAATLSGLYNCQVCGQEKCVEPGICDDCLAPPTEFELNQEWQA